MAISAVQMLAASIVNALTFELLVDIPITFVVNNSGPWATSVGVVGTLLFLTACVVYAFPDIVCHMNKEGLIAAFYTLLRYLLPWIALRLLWTPGNYLLCRLTVKLFRKRCHRQMFLNIAQLVFGGLCLYSALHRTGLTRDFECWLVCFWRQTFIYRLFFGCCGRPAGAGNTIPPGARTVTYDVVIQHREERTREKGKREESQVSKRSGSKSRSEGRSTSGSRKRRQSGKRCR